MLDHFESLGFEKKEANVYLLLCEIGRASGNLIAKRAGLPRSTCYSLLERLRKVGLVSTVLDQNTTIYVASDPSVLVRQVNERRRTVEAQHRLATELAKLINPLMGSKRAGPPRVQFFEGSHSIQQMMDEHLEQWFDSMRKYDNVLWGYQDHTLEVSYLAWLKKYWSNKDPNHKISLFSNQPGVAQQQRLQVKNREIRRLPGDSELDSTLWISGDYITLIMTREEPHYAVQICDARLSSNLRVIFNVLWNGVGE